MKVTGIATQGRQDADQWVTAYRIYYSSDGVYFSSVKYWWNSYVKVRKRESPLYQGAKRFSFTAWHLGKL